MLKLVTKFKAAVNLDELLIDAVFGGNLDIIEFLLANGANIHAKDDEALRYAVFGGNLDIIKFLLANGADVYAQNDNLVLMVDERN